MATGAAHANGMERTVAEAIGKKVDDAAIVLRGDFATGGKPAVAFRLK